MKIRITKQALLEALTPLSRLQTQKNHLLLVSQSKTMSLIVSDENSQLAITPEQACTDGDGQQAVDINRFKTAVERSTSTDLELAVSNGTLALMENGSTTDRIPCMKTTSSMKTVAAEADTTTLPTGFACFLIQAFRSTSKDPSRPVLHGVNVGRKGIAATDGKQLFHIPLPLTMANDVLLPPSPLYAALRKHHWRTLSAWGDQFAITGTGFQFIMKVHPGSYPCYEKVCSTDADITAEFNEAERSKAIDFLKGIPRKGDAPTEIWVYQNRIELTAPAQRTHTIAATSTGNNLPHGICCNAGYILQALSLGHTRLGFFHRKHDPIIATGGAGKYLFMPLNITVDRPTVDISPEPTSSPSNNKEKNTMQTPTVTTGLSRTTAPAAGTADTNEPLNALSASLAAMREHLDDLNARLTEAGRKIREVLVQQRQKERTYQEASRKLERIRMAV